MSLLVAAVVAATLQFPKASPVPGGVLVFPIESASAEPPVVTFEGQRSMVLPVNGHWAAVVGVPLSEKPGHVTVLVRDGGASGVEKSVGFDIVNKQYVTQSLKVAPSKVDLSAEDEARASRESAHIKETVATYSDPPPKTLRLLQPVPGIRTSSYGSRRIFNNEPKN